MKADATQLDQQQDAIEIAIVRLEEIRNELERKGELRLLADVRAVLRGLERIGGDE